MSQDDWTEDEVLAFNKLFHNPPMSMSGRQYAEQLVDLGERIERRRNEKRNAELMKWRAGLLRADGEK